MKYNWINYPFLVDPNSSFKDIKLLISEWNSHIFLIAYMLVNVEEDIIWNNSFYSFVYNLNNYNV